METLTVKLSAKQTAYILDQVRSRQLKSADEYISHLILLEQMKPQRAAIDELLLEGARGPFTDLTNEDLQDIEREGLKKLAEESKNGRKSAKKQQRSKRPA